MFKVSNVSDESFSWPLLMELSYEMSVMEVDSIATIKLVTSPIC